METTIDTNTHTKEGALSYKITFNNKDFSIEYTADEYSNTVALKVVEQLLSDILENNRKEVRGSKMPPEEKQKLLRARFLINKITQAFAGYAKWKIIADEAKVEQPIAQ